jgi:putative hydrolase of the HAD superfamily
MGTKTFVFDCGGVLLRDRDQATTYRQWELRLGLAEGELPERLWSGDIWEQAQIGKISEEQYWEQIGASLGLSDTSQVNALSQELWDRWVLDDKVLNLIDRARQRHRLALLSNATTALEEMLDKRYGVADRFATIVNSARVGVAKPDPAIYQELLRQLDAQPQEIVFIDDRAENVTAAAALGMHVIWYVGPEELERQLQVYLRPDAITAANGGHANGNGHDTDAHDDGNLDD